MVILNAIQSVLTIVIIIAIGYILTVKGWFDEKVSKLFTNLVINISLPMLMVTTLMGAFDSEKLKHMGIGLVIPFASMLICYAIAELTARIIKVKKGRKGTYKAMFFASNTIFMGMPVNIALFGEKSVPYVLMYYIANTTLFWTLGIFAISKDCGMTNEKLFSMETVKKVFSPPLLAFIAAVVLILLKIQLPMFLMDTFKYLGNLTTPLSLLFIGITFHSVSTKEIKPDWDMVTLFLGRFALAPLVVVGLAMLIPIPALMTKVFVIQAAMPVITQAAITTKAYDADYKYAAVMVTVTTVASLVFIPIYMVLMSGMN